MIISTKAVEMEDLGEKYNCKGPLKIKNMVAVFLPGESQGQGSLVGCRLWGCTESDTTEVT